MSVVSSTEKTIGWLAPTRPAAGRGPAVGPGPVVGPGPPGPGGGQDQPGIAGPGHGPPPTGKLVEREWIVEVPQSSVSGERELRFAYPNLWSIVYKSIDDNRRRASPRPGSG